jgi:hypothetical protein
LGILEFPVFQPSGKESLIAISRRGTQQSWRERPNTLVEPGAYLDKPSALKVRDVQLAFNKFDPMEASILNL